MKIKSTRFGELQVSPERIFEFPQGLPGFPEEKKFAFLPYEPDSPFSFLQSLHDPDLAFIIVDPFHFFPDYNFEIDDQMAGDMGLTEDNKPQILTIVTVPEKLSEMTANLVAPIVINRRKLKAWQLVLEKNTYSTRHLLFPDGQVGKQSDKGGK